MGYRIALSHSKTTAMSSASILTPRPIYRRKSTFSKMIPWKAIAAICCATAIGARSTSVMMPFSLRYELNGKAAPRGANQIHKATMLRSPPTSSSRRIDSQSENRRHADCLAMDPAPGRRQRELSGYGPPAVHRMDRLPTACKNPRRSPRHRRRRDARSFGRHRRAAL